MRFVKVIINVAISAFIYLPVSAQTNNKTQITDLYKEYFCPADQLDPQWSGDFLQINQGSISADYKNAVLKRLLFMRSLAGISNSIQIDENLTSQAQRLSFFYSLNFLDGRMNGVWDPFKLVNSSTDRPDFDPYYVFRLYSPELQELAKLSHSATSNTISHALLDLIRARNGEQGTTSAGEWDPEPKYGYPLTTIKLLSPDLNAVGIGTVQTNTPIKYNSFTGADMEHVPSGVLTTNKFELNSGTGNNAFNPLVWPPSGYVPYMISGPKWIAYQTGADFRGAYVSVRAANDPSFQYKAKLIERDESTPDSAIAWSMNAFPSQGRAFNFPTGNVEERTYDVTIGNILFNGQIKELKYKVTEFNPFTDFTKTRIQIDIPNKVSGSESNFLRVRVFTEDGCLIRLVDPPFLTGSIPGRKNLILRAGYSTSPDGPFNFEGPTATPIVFDTILMNKLDDEGFYVIDLQSDNAQLNGQTPSHIYTTLKRTEVFQFSKQYGYRKLTEQFKEPVSEIDISSADSKLKSQKPGDKPNITPTPGGNNSNSALDKLMKKFKKLKAKNSQCAIKKKQNMCRDSKCQSQCSKTKKSLKTVRANITKITGVKPK